MREKISAEGGEGSYPLLVKLYVSIFWQKKFRKRLINETIKKDGK